MNMKPSLYFSAFILIMTASCARTADVSGSSSLTIVNAVTGSNSLVTNFTGSVGSKNASSFIYYSSALQIPYGSFQEIGSYTGRTPLSISDITDTMNSVFYGTLTLPVGSIHTLFMTGTLTTPDSLFTADIVPYYPYYGDSLTGVRFVNLSPGSTPVTVDLQGVTDSIPVLSGLSYKTVSAFQPFSANTNAMNNGYTFEFRDGLGNVLTSTGLNILPFKSQTLALYGNAANGYAIMAINNY